MRVFSVAIFGIIVGATFSPREAAFAPADDATLPLDFEDQTPALRSALSKAIDVDFEKAPLQKAVAVLSQQAGVNIVLDLTSLASAKVAVDQPVSLQVKRVRLTTALELILDEFNLTAEVRSDVIVVVDRQSAKKLNVFRLYPVADLIVNPNGGWTDPEGRRLAQVVFDSVDRDLWEPNGGDCTISFVLQGLAFNINAPNETHRKVKSLLDAVRRMREQTARLLERSDLGALEQSLVETDKTSVSPIGFYQPLEYPPAAKVQGVVEILPAISQIASNALSLAQRLEGELNQLRKAPNPGPQEKNPHLSQ